MDMTKSATANLSIWRRTLQGLYPVFQY